MAKGSQKTYGGWEVRTCYHCGRRLTLNDPAMSSYPTGGQPFDLCAEHQAWYAEAFADMGPAENVDQADSIHPDQLTLDA